MTAQSEMAWSGFQSGETAEASLNVGTYPAFMRGDIREIPTQYGSALKVYYNLFVQGRNGWRVYEMSELCSPTYTTGAKFMRRLAAVNGATITEDTDLSKLGTSGWVLVTLERDRRNGQYLNIADVVPMPRNYPKPNVLSPESPPERFNVNATESTQDVPF